MKNYLEKELFEKLDWKEIGVSKIHLKVAFKKKNLEYWDFRKIKFKNLNLGKLNLKL